MIKDDVRAATIGVAASSNGEVRVMCPACKGGGTGEASMAVNMDTGWYICYRAGCGVTGNIGMVMSSVRRESFKRKQPVIDDPPIQSILDTIPTLIRERISWPIETAWGRVAYQVRSGYGNLEGHVLRSYTGHEPKALTYVDDYCGLHFPRYNKPSVSITLVEDIPSAEALSPYTPTAALLGSSITQEHKKYLDQMGIRMVYLALDDDATAKAIAQSRRHLSIDVQPVILTKDPKDMSNTELQEVAEVVNE